MLSMSSGLNRGRYRNDSTRPRVAQQRARGERGLGPTYISGIERGVRNPTLTTIWKLAEALGVAPSRLLKAAEE
jgi:transcriptional regulator with XRE-family HTH domain